MIGFALGTYDGAPGASELVLCIGRGVAALDASGIGVTANEVLAVVVAVVVVVVVVVGIVVESLN